MIIILQRVLLSLNGPQSNLERDTDYITEIYRPNTFPNRARRDL